MIQIINIIIILKMSLYLLKISINKHNKLFFIQITLKIHLQWNMNNLLKKWNYHIVYPCISIRGKQLRVMY